MKDKLNKNKPKHIAVIMDGNGRWATNKGLSRVEGHKNGVRSVREISECCAEVGIQYLTLYAFSTENWSRPKEEVDALMELLVETIKNEVSTLNENNIRLNAIGDIQSLPLSCQLKLNEAIKDTSQNSGMILTLALSYSSRWEITNAIKSIVKAVQSGNVSEDDITEELISSHLCTSTIPDPELMIRTSGERRVSNYLLWQMAYTEFYFSDVFWPDFRKEHLMKAIEDYQSRERRFGKTSDQLK